MNSSMSAHLEDVPTKFVARSRKNSTTEEDESSSLLNHTSNRGQAVKRKVRAIHEHRVSRVETLREQVREGIYRVNTRVLAERILENGTHFMESTQE